MSTKWVHAKEWNCGGFLGSDFNSITAGGFSGCQPVRNVRKVLNSGGSSYFSYFSVFLEMAKKREFWHFRFLILPMYGDDKFKSCLLSIREFPEIKKITTESSTRLFKDISDITEPSNSSIFKVLILKTSLWLFRVNYVN